MEASPLDLRSVTVIPRALLEAIRGDDDNNNNNPANINSPLQTSPPGWFVNPFEDPLTLINSKSDFYSSGDRFVEILCKEIVRSNLINVPKVIQNGPKP